MELNREDTDKENECNTTKLERAVVVIIYVRERERCRRRREREREIRRGRERERRRERGEKSIHLMKPEKHDEESEKRHKCEPKRSYTGRGSIVDGGRYK